MTLATAARLSRRHLPGLATHSGLGGARAAAVVREVRRLPFLAPSHHVGQLLPSHLRKLGGGLPPAQLRQPRRWISSGGKKCGDVDPCVAEEVLRAMKELKEISEDLDRDLYLFKSTLVLVFGAAMASIVSFPVQLSTMRMDTAELHPKLRKRHAESQMVAREVELGRTRAVELQQWFAEERAKK